MQRGEASLQLGNHPARRDIGAYQSSSLPLGQAWNQPAGRVENSLHVRQEYEPARAKRSRDFARRRVRVDIQQCGSGPAVFTRLHADGRDNRDVARLQRRLDGVRVHINDVPDKSKLRVPDVRPQHAVVRAADANRARAKLDHGSHEVLVDETREDGDNDVQARRVRNAQPAHKTRHHTLFRHPVADNFPPAMHHHRVDPLPLKRNKVMECGVVAAESAAAYLDYNRPTGIGLLLRLAGSMYLRLSVCLRRVHPYGAVRQGAV